MCSEKCSVGRFAALMSARTCWLAASRRRGSARNLGANGFELRIFDGGAREIVPHPDRDPLALLRRLFGKGEGELLERATMTAQPRTDAPHDPGGDTRPAVRIGAADEPQQLHRQLSAEAARAIEQQPSVDELAVGIGPVDAVISAPMNVSYSARWSTTRQRSRKPAPSTTGGRAAVRKMCRK